MCSMCLCGKTPLHPFFPSPQAQLFNLSLLRGCIGLTFYFLRLKEKIIYIVEIEIIEDSLMQVFFYRIVRMPHPANKDPLWLIFFTKLSHNRVYLINCKFIGTASIPFKYIREVFKHDIGLGSKNFGNFYETVFIFFLVI